jgi:histidinol-phosphate aminotransferase
VVGRDAAELKQKLADNGIMVRYYSKPERLAGCIRISVGKPEQTQAIMRVLAQL